MQPVRQVDPSEARQTVTPRISSERLRQTLSEINDFGRDPATGGYDRPAFGAADMACRARVAEMMRDCRLDVRTDAVGNTFGRFGPADGPAILIGSHTDTVPQGGAFDGALGVAAALECVRAMQDAGISPRRAVEVVNTVDEEGRFGGMLGSQAMAGIVGADWVAQARDPSGTRLADAMAAHGLDPNAADAARLAPGHAAAFLELHIEQGPVLERACVPVGLVTTVSGCCVLQITLTGQANHSGTTPMHLRADAFAGLAQAAAAIPDIVASRGTDQSRLTIGHVALEPDEVHTIPGRADFSLVLRDTDETVMRRLRDGFESALRAAAEDHGLAVAIEARSWLPPVDLDPDLRAAMVEGAAASGHAVLEMPSGAGHDAQTMQAVCPSALVFVPSRGGISHAPGEHTDWPACVAGAEVLLTTLMRLASAR